MHLLVAPTFLHIVMLLTVLIYVWIVFGVIWFAGITTVGYFTGWDFPVSSVSETGEVTMGVEHPRGRRYVALRLRAFRWRAFFFAGLGFVNHLARLWLPRMPPSTARVALGTVVVLIFAIILFFIKKSALIIYGSMEGLFALGACISSLMTKVGVALTPDALVVLFSSIYLMIRAMDNITKGIPEFREKVSRHKEEIKHAVEAGVRAYKETVRSDGPTGN